jgi:ribonuclease Z
MVLGDERKGIKLVYVTDTRPVPVIAEMAEGADLFICEGMYGEPGMDDKARQNRHMTMQEGAALAAKAQPEMLWFTHYSPSLMRPEQFMDEIREIFPRALAARDGQEITLTFKEDE